MQVYTNKFKTIKWFHCPELWVGVFLHFKKTWVLMGVFTMFLHHIWLTSTKRSFCKFNTKKTYGYGMDAHGYVMGKKVLPSVVSYRISNSVIQSLTKGGNCKIFF